MNVPCKVCNSGTMVRQKISRMSPMVVAIGWILLVPSILGVIGSAGCAAASCAGGAAVATTDAPKETLDQLRAKAVPDDIVDKIAKGRPLGDADRKRLKPDQLSTVEGVVAGLNIAKGGAAVGSAIGAGMFTCTGIGSLVSGLLGWLLVMKRWVLRCQSCSAVQDAS